LNLDKLVDPYAYTVCLAKSSRSMFVRVNVNESVSIKCNAIVFISSVIRHI